MCDLGICSEIKLANQCMFPSDKGFFHTPSDDYHDQIFNVVPYSCLPVINSSYQDQYNAYADQACQGMAPPPPSGEDPEWIAAKAQYGIAYSAYEFAHYQFDEYKNTRCRQSVCPSTFTSGYNVVIKDDHTDTNPNDFYQPAPNLEICSRDTINQGNDTIYYSLFCNKTSTYSGNPLICCLQNLNCSFADDPSYNIRQGQRYNPLCFDTNTPSNNSRQCPLEYRQSTSESCMGLLTTYCTTGDSSNDLANKWIGQKLLPNYESSANINTGYVSNKGCLKKFFNILFAGVPGSIPGSECYDKNIQMMEAENLDVLPEPTIQNARNAQNLLTNAVMEYLRLGGDLDLNSTSPNASLSFNRMVHKLCKQIPGICTGFLGYYCQSKSENDLRRNPDLIQVCGCYVPNSVVSVYTDTFQINPECTPYCNVPNVIPLPNSLTSFSGKNCAQSTCVINDISLNFVNSSVSNLNIGNFCGSCNAKNSKGVCNCILTDLTFTSIQSQISSLNLSQQCSSGSCYTLEKDSQGKTVQKSVPCNEGLVDFEKKEVVDAKQTLFQGGITIAIVIGIVIILFLLYLFFNPRGYIFGNPVVTYPESRNFMPARPFTSLGKVWK